MNGQLADGLRHGAFPHLAYWHEHAVNYGCTLSCCRLNCPQDNLRWPTSRYCSCQRLFLWPISHFVSVCSLFSYRTLTLIIASFACFLRYIALLIGITHVGALIIQLVLVQHRDGPFRLDGIFFRRVVCLEDESIAALKTSQFATHKQPNTIFYFGVCVYYTLCYVLEHSWHCAVSFWSAEDKMTVKLRLTLHWKYSWSVV